MTTAEGQSAMEIPWDAIAQRAYELYAARGYEPGHDFDDWLQAEAELRAEATAETEPEAKREPALAEA